MPNVNEELVSGCKDALKKADAKSYYARTGDSGDLIAARTCLEFMAPVIADIVEERVRAELQVQLLSRGIITEMPPRVDWSGLLKTTRERDYRER
jgi:hypothetical protein